jgi:hypothetical protein
MESIEPAITPDVRVFAHPERTAESDKRLDILDRTISGYQERHDFIEGATVYGSTVHGGGHTESDFDTFVYVDPNQLPEEFSTEIDGVRTMTEDDQLAMGKAIQVDLMSELGQKVVKKEGGESEKNDVRVVPMSEEIIKERLGEWFKTHKDFAIAGLFHPAVGEKGDIRRLRIALLDELGSMPNGQEIWKDIATFWIPRGETPWNGGKLPDMPEAARLPESLEDARRSF